MKKPDSRTPVPTTRDIEAILHDFAKKLVTPSSEKYDEIVKAVESEPTEYASDAEVEEFREHLEQHIAERDTRESKVVRLLHADDETTEEDYSEISAVAARQGNNTSQKEKDALVKTAKTIRKPKKGESNAQSPTPDGPARTGS